MVTTRTQPVKPDICCVGSDGDDAIAVSLCTSTRRQQRVRRQSVQLKNLARYDVTAHNVNVQDTVKES